MSDGDVKGLTQTQLTTVLPRWHTALEWYQGHGWAYGTEVMTSAISSAEEVLNAQALGRNPNQRGR